MAFIDNLQEISDTIWELPASYKEGMRVPARIIATEKLVREMDEAVYQQISNVATLPGIARYALCMPDGHSGYGFPIGGVAAMDVHEGGVISPGGIGFDINCGMRLIITNLTLDDVQPHLHGIVDRLYERVPAGVGSHGFLKLSRQDFRDRHMSTCRALHGDRARAGDRARTPITWRSASHTVVGLEALSAKRPSASVLPSICCLALRLTS